ncbi:MAG: hypothetical protein GWN99_03805 [Gemmatimonadetes bacterium]|uniref:BIG2 domain-containing protein n=1 Tax=Candidatus Kutchimonas denitrificans TaxID=3056748 RepID=A0AAE5CC61_9BACT|nr:hypothetical protein [Gemmatimonadota bacterium]NIR75255.1 hypothetical protein [Candidatus Kutchimonas denitrificans]NIS00193.1 hypothetical protein [Gemmatimonadota bacterium]NIT65785.1 hypothetical protein [Gemmatimonadota bacterium]NIU53063.1 hypothetical protein [Gemmatimonadota bacterium]
MRARLDDLAAEATIVVTPDPVVGLQVSPDTLRLPSGAEADLTAQARRASGRLTLATDVRWDSEKSFVARITAEGRVTGVGAGRTRVTAHSGVLSAIAVIDVPGWFQVQPMPAATRAGHAAAYGTRVYYFGGRTRFGYTSEVFAYDVVSEAWSTLPSMPVARDQGALAMLDDRIHIIGGLADTGVSDKVEAFDPLEEKWLTLPSLPVARYEARAAALDGIIYVMGGRLESSDVTDRVDALVP